jgi:hypothetical protein
MCWMVRVLSRNGFCHRPLGEDNHVVLDGILALDDAFIHSHSVQMYHVGAIALESRWYVVLMAPNRESKPL